MHVDLPGRLGVGSPDADELEARLARARTATPDYSDIGATLRPDPIAGEHVESIEVGRGASDFAAATVALRTWVAQRGIGARVIPADQVVEAGATVLLVVRRGPFFLVAPDRVIDVISEPRRFAFAYGTLPGHPERGEEAFVVDWLDDDRVTATIRVAARTATRTLALVAPVVRRVQHAALRRYLAAIGEFVADARS